MSYYDSKLLNTLMIKMIIWKYIKDVVNIEQKSQIISTNTM